MWTEEQIKEEYEHQDGIKHVKAAAIRAKILKKILGEHPDEKEN